MWVYLGRLSLKFGRTFGTSTSSVLRNAAQEIKEVAKPSQANSATASGPKDIVLFRYENPRFFKYLSFFALTQFGFWGYLSATSLTMISVPVKDPVNKVADSHSGNNETLTESVDKIVTEDLPFWRKINLGSDMYKYGLCIGSFLMGYGILVISWTYILRSVRYLILRKDRKSVSFVTYGPFGKNRIMDVPLDCISAAGSRASETSQMPIKVKDRRLFYILDLKQGKFPQPQLFDQTVGLKRKFR